MYHSTKLVPIAFCNSKFNFFLFKKKKNTKFDYTHIEHVGCLCLIHLPFLMVNNTFASCLYVVFGYIHDFFHLETTLLIYDLSKCNQCGTSLLLT